MDFGDHGENGIIIGAIDLGDCLLIWIVRTNILAAVY